MLSPTMETRVTALLEVLDADIRNLEATSARLATLRTLVLRRDHPALEELLGQVSGQAEGQRANEQRRQQVRRELAGDLGCAARDLTLSRLQQALAGPLRAAVADRQGRLRSLTLQLKREHALTTLLLRDCIRFNRSLLQILLGSAERGPATYGPTGAARAEGGATLMSMQL